MSLVRRIARPMLASMFIIGGLDAIRRPGARPQAAAALTHRLAAMTPLPDSPTLLVRLNGAIMVGAGTMLATSRLPRLSAAALAVTAMPTTFVRHPLWKGDAAQRARNRTEFFSNVSMLGGLLLAAADTDGQPGLAYRAQVAREQAQRSLQTGRRTARLLARSAVKDAKITALQAHNALS